MDCQTSLAKVIHTPIKQIEEINGFETGHGKLIICICCLICHSYYLTILAQ